MSPFPSSTNLSVARSLMRSVGLIPLREFSGPLKRIRLDENETMAMLILDLAFPHFRGLDSSNEQHQRIFSYFYGDGEAKRLARQSPRRRFSGGGITSEVLPRGRYYSLCKQKPSSDLNSLAVRFDHGVIQNELLAYANWRAAGPIMVFDWQEEQDHAFLRKLGRAGDSETWDAYCGGLIEGQILTGACILS